MDPDVRTTSRCSAALGEAAEPRTPNLVAYVLALSSALFYGAADFVGGLVSRRAHTIAVVVISQSAGLVLLAIVVPLMPATHPSQADLLWGAAAGLFGSAGVALLYQALAIGTMAVVAPTTAVCAVAIPVFAAGLAGDLPSPIAAAGILVAVIAIVLAGQERSQRPTPKRTNSQEGWKLWRWELGVRHRAPPGLGLALLSGVAIGGFFLALARTSPASGMWPLLSSRGLAVVLFAIVAIVMRVPMRMPARLAGLAIFGGALDVLANGLYVAATRYGSLPVVVTLASLYPASTVLLAAALLRERLNALQIAGVVLALAAVVLIVGAG